MIDERLVRVDKWLTACSHSALHLEVMDWKTEAAIQRKPFSDFQLRIKNFRNYDVRKTVETITLPFNSFKTSYQFSISILLDTLNQFIVSAQSFLYISTSLFHLPFPYLFFVYPLFILSCEFLRQSIYTFLLPFPLCYKYSIIKQFEDSFIT
jgi:hypothetical protein